MDKLILAGGLIAALVLGLGSLTASDEGASDRTSGTKGSDTVSTNTASTNTAHATADTYTKPNDEELQERLTPLQYKVTQHEGTERAFTGEYWDNKDKGIYVDVVSGEPLFSSNEKYKSGTGWPSFWAPIERENIVEKVDNSLFMSRTEVRSKHGDSHLGHLFPDGPEPTGQRYCINSASLRFVPVDRLEAEGYGEYLSLFEDK